MTSFSFDDIWDRLPHNSAYQIRLLICVGYVGFIGGFMAIYPVFAQFKPDIRCETIFDTDPMFNFLTFEEIKSLTTDTPACQGYNSDSNDECWNCNFTDLSTCSFSDPPNFDEVAACVEQPTFQEQFEWVECADHSFNRAAIRNTTNMKDEPWQTSVTEFGLFCGQDELNALLTSMGMVGLFIGAFIAGLYADKFGRKNAIMVFTLLEVACQVAHSFMPNVWGFMAFRVLSQMTNHVTWIAYISYSVEILGPSKRSLAGAMTHVFYSFGYMATSLVGYLLPDWHGFTLCLGILTAATVVTFPFYPESFRFFYNCGKIQEGRKVVEEFRRKTNADLDDAFLDEFEANLQIAQAKTSGNDKTYSIVDLFLNGKELVLVSMNVGTCFLVNTLVYYGLSYNAAALPGNLYVNNAINGLVELLAYLLCVALLDRLGRRVLLVGAMMLGGVCCLTSMVLIEVSESDTDPTAVAATWFSFAGKFAISGSFCALYVFAAELFSTDIRTIGVGFGSMLGRVGGVAAPFIILLPGFAPNLIFGVTAILSGAWAFFLPETAGKPMMQTIGEARDFYRGKKTDETTNEETNSNL